jgi:DNA-directed RNA polymerase omega subunit
MGDEKNAVTEAIQLINNRYLLVNAAVKRVKTLKKKVTFSEVESDGTFINRALQEIAEGKIKVKSSTGKAVNPSSGGNGGGKSWAA